MSRFIFIAGAEGSGTTLLSRLLSAPAACLSLGGNYVKPADQEHEVIGRFQEANRALWDRYAPFGDNHDARRRWREALAEVKARFSDRTHVLFKQSFPFGSERGRYTPDLWDVVDLEPETRFVVIYRDPPACTYSALRRGFDTDVRRLAVVCGEQLTWLSAQAAAVQNVHLVSYERFCAEPLAELAPLAAFLELPMEELSSAVAAEGVRADQNQRWRRDLPAETVTALEGYFDERRRRQWALLQSCSAR